MLATAWLLAMVSDANDPGTGGGTENDEGSDAATSEPSIESGVARLQEGPSKPSPVGSTPTTSTLMRRKLMSETSTAAHRLLFVKSSTVRH